MGFLVRSAFRHPNTVSSIEDGWSLCLTTQKIIMVQLTMRYYFYTAVH